MHPALAGIELIVFDLDGTLIDSAPDLATAVDAMLAAYDAPPAGVEKIRGWVGNGTHKLVERALDDARRCQPTPALKAAAPAQAYRRFLEAYAHAPCRQTRVFDGARECLDRLTGNRTLALVTNKPGEFLPPILDALDLHRYFALTLGGDALAEKKPHPLPLLHTAEQFGIALTNSLIIGDSSNDIEAGKTAGFRSLAVTYGYNHGQPIAASQPDYLVDSLAELIADETG